MCRRVGGYPITSQRVRRHFCLNRPNLVNVWRMPPGEHAPFVTTHWSLVLAAGHENAQNHAEALNELCQTYWPPLYSYLRREGRSPEQAADLTQGFFAQVLQRGVLGHADPLRGRFRSFLLTSLRNFMLDQLRMEAAQKRGGGRDLLVLDTGVLDEEEAQFAVTPVTSETPEHLYLRRWAAALLELAMNRTRSDYEKLGQGPLFEVLKHSIWGAKDSESSSELAARLRLTSGAVRTATTRLRERFRLRLRGCVAETLSPEATEPEIDAELRELTAVLR